MSDLRDLYQQVIIDHSKSPRNFGPLPEANRSAKGHNPLCGDRITLYLLADENGVREARFEGSGCAISTASASMMTEAIRGKSLEEVERLFQGVHRMLTAEPGKETPDASLGKLAVFSGVCEFPTRVKCATLAWHTLQNALENAGEVASTE